MYFLQTIQGLIYWFKYIAIPEIYEKSMKRHYSVNNFSNAYEKCNVQASNFMKI